MRAHRYLPRVTAVGAQEEREFGHVCGKCRQPVTNRGVDWCPNNRPVREDDIESPDEEVWPGEGDDYREAWYESARVDADVDRMREDRHFGV